MAETILLREEKGIRTCNVPITAGEWSDMLHDPEIITPERLRVLLIYYYMPNRTATYVECALRFGGSFNTYNNAIMGIGKAIIKKMGTFQIVDAAKKELFWPVVMGKCKKIRNSDDILSFTLRQELVEALGGYILRDALSQYEDDFTSNWEKGNYKWQALKVFHNNWDIDAPDFAEMLNRSLSLTGNLLASQGSFTRVMITSYAKQAPETVRTMFKELFDESSGLKPRIKKFMRKSKKLAQQLSPGNMHYQITNPISTYLWLRYPGKYCNYKWSEFSSICKKIFLADCPKANGELSEVMKGYEINQILQNTIKQSDSIISLYHSCLGKNPSKYLEVDGLATLAGDFGFWISRYYTPLIPEETSSSIESVKEQQNTIVTEPEGSVAPSRYWWLVASPKYWSFADLKVGETIDYTVKNDKGNKRRIPANFENAKVGDIVVGYEAHPVKKIVALAKVIKASNGETITFEKTETLEFPISWFGFKDLDSLRDMEFIKNQNGSFFKLTPDEYEVILELIRQENQAPDDTNPIKKRENFEPYSKIQLLSEVFMTEQELDDLAQLLRLKKNVILQGAPGVGKTFSAKRIAFYMMGKKDTNRVEMVQFHQNYSYEDFIMGYRPTAEGGFELRKGVFYNFCKKAEEQPEKDFFFIIDEINRGNLSKIFGELLMLIESSYREHSIKLAYSGELFSVPKNLYIIGMMNTADRSLAMIDYALRRRFSFHSMTPGFKTEGFKAEMAKHTDSRINEVINAVVTLNDKIARDDSLGSGFCIGHSYFCEQPTDKPWIEHVVKYDICPMLDEYWFDSKDKCEAEKSRLLELLK